MLQIVEYISFAHGHKKIVMRIGYSIIDFLFCYVERKQKRSDTIDTSLDLMGREYCRFDSFIRGRK